MKNKLTKVQYETLKMIMSYIHKNGESPKLKEIADELNIKTSTASDRVNRLVKAGCLVKNDKGSKNIELVSEKVTKRHSFVHIPLLAEVGADNAEIFSEDISNSYIQVDSNLINKYKDIFAVRAKGNSMKDAGIKDGDYIIVESRNIDQISSGDIVVATVDGMALIKKIEIGRDTLILHPENRDGGYYPIVISKDTESFKLLGRMVQILHKTEPDDVEFEEL